MIASETAVRSGRSADRIGLIVAGALSGALALALLAGGGALVWAHGAKQDGLIMVAFGLVIGTCVALPGLAFVSRDLTGSAMPSGPLWVYGALLGFYAVLAFAASGVSARLALRMDPVAAMAARE